MLIMYNPTFKCVLGFPFHTRASRMKLRAWERQGTDKPLTDESTETEILTHLMKLVRQAVASIDLMAIQSTELGSILEGFADPTMGTALPGVARKSTMQSFGSKDSQIQRAILGDADRDDEPGLEDNF